VLLVPLLNDYEFMGVGKQILICFACEFDLHLTLYLVSLGTSYRAYSNI
jgi:hypothetical protein